MKLSMEKLILVKTWNLLQVSFIFDYMDTDSVFLLFFLEYAQTMNPYFTDFILLIRLNEIP